MRKILTLISAITFATNIMAGDPDSLVNRGNELYEAANYEQAIALYIEADNLIESADLHFNLGNAYYKNNELGKSILHYEKALMLEPGDEDIKHNLKLAKNLTLDKLDDSVENDFSIWWTATLLKIGMDRLAYLSILAAFLSVIGWIMFRVSTTRNKRQLGFTMGIGCLIIAIGTSLSSLDAKSSIMYQSNGIILSKRVAVQSAPDEESTELFILHEGSKVTIESVRGAWTNVSIPNGNEGWMKSHQIEGI
ncbi:MAG: tetratricopeptide repeat protein [Flavobacteriales bacterium]|nr:tetratricopeptide repeat protein [Flavobacteriales bacterium]